MNKIKCTNNINRIVNHGKYTILNIRYHYGNSNWNVCE